MYTHYFSLTQAAFSIAPDPRFLFMSERHREALAHLLYGVGSGGGFVLLTGEIGAGKTTVCRCFMEQIPENCRLGYIFNPKLTVEELLLSICDEFQIVPAAGAPSVKRYVDAINRYLLDSHAQGKNNVLIIDEAQNLSADVLEQLRLLTNLETNERKLLQIILIGQPELRAMLARPELEQLAQRVIARYHLASLSARETGGYVAHRLAVAGAGAQTLFPASLIARLHALSGGVPRRINLLCDRALLGAYVENTRAVTPAILRRAAAEVFSESAGAPVSWRRPARVAAVVAGVAGVALSAVIAWQWLQQAAPAPAMQARAPLAAAAQASALLPGSANEQQALRELARLWGAALSGPDACQAAPARKLRCHQGKGGLYQLRLLDRPAVLTLRDGAKLSYVMLSAMDADTVSLTLGGKQHKLSVAALTARFDGSFTTFWSMPHTFREQIAMNARGPDVDWIAAQLAKPGQGGLARPSGAFDASMQAALRRFQSKHHLTADGLVGPLTYMRLNRSAGVAEPRLLTAATGK